MAQGQGLSPLPLDLPALKWDSGDMSRFVVDYDQKPDTLHIGLPQPRPATSIALNDDTWVRVDPTTGDILGFEIEDFKQVFLKKHPELALAWEKIERQQSQQKMAAAVAILLQYLRSLGGLDHPQQGQLLPHSG